MFLPGYIWYWENGISLVLLYGINYRWENQESKKENEYDNIDKDFIDEGTRTGVSPFPVFLVGYTF